MLIKVFCYSCGRICHAYKDFEIMPKDERRKLWLWKLVENNNDGSEE